MSDNTLLYGIIVGVLLVGLGLVLVLGGDTKAVKVGGIKVASISKSAKVIWVDPTVAGRVRTLKFKGRLVVFQGEAKTYTPLPEDALAAAELEAYLKLSKYLGSKVESVESRVLEEIDKMNVNEEEKKLLSSNVTVAFNRTINVISNNKTIGARTIVHYYDVKSNTYGVVVLYDYEQAMKVLKDVIQMKEAILEYPELAEIYAKILEDELSKTDDAPSSAEE